MNRFRLSAWSASRAAFPYVGKKIANILIAFTAQGQNRDVKIIILPVTEMTITTGQQHH